MVLNDFRQDFKELCKEEDVSQASIAKELGLTKQGIYRRVARNVMAKGFVEACEALGYDIEVRYIRQKM